MSLDDLAREQLNPERGNRDRYIGVFIGLLAVVLAICSMGGGNAAQEATQKNIEASNTWSFFQAKNLRRQALRLKVEDLELMPKANPALSEEARQAIAAKLTEHKATIDRLTSEPEKGEGLDQLLEKGKRLEVERDTALKRGPYFDYGGALLQIAIVLASVAIISGGQALLIGSALLAVFGIAATIGGFTLAFPLPFAG